MKQDERRNAGEPVGKSEMDAEHELLHRLLDELKDELVSGGSRIDELFDRFDTAAQAHFLGEQSLMRLHAYPGYEGHQNEHDELIDQLHRLASRIEDGAAGDAARVALAKLNDALLAEMRRNR